MVFFLNVKIRGTDAADAANEVDAAGFLVWDDV